MASKKHPHTVSVTTKTVTFANETPGQNVLEICSTTLTGPHTSGTTEGVEEGSAESQAAKNEAEVKDTVEELMESSRMRKKALDPSKPRRIVSV